MVVLCEVRYIYVRVRCFIARNSLDIGVCYSALGFLRFVHMFYCLQSCGFSLFLAGFTDRVLTQRKMTKRLKLASLKVEEFDLRLDEGMVRWAQGLADKLMWTLVAEGRADEMETWRLPEEAFCSSQVMFFMHIDT